MIKILLADDHKILREGLKISINILIANAVIDEAWDTDSVLEKIQVTDYKLIILDTKMKGINSFGLVSSIISIKSDVNILIFAMHPSVKDAKKYLKLGAKGYTSKTSSHEMENAINMVLQAQ